ncbi:MAG TPA: hypothetical protein PKA58_18180, partial [Polyangium sp.]|nr:hypothetical protein [Polyangium sp.]
MKRTIVLLLGCGLVLGVMGGCEEAKVQTEPCAAPATPAGYTGYLTFIADGSYDPADPNYTPPTLEAVMRD